MRASVRLVALCVVLSSQAQAQAQTQDLRPRGSNVTRGSQKGAGQLPPGVADDQPREAPDDVDAPADEEIRRRECARWNPDFLAAKAPPHECLAVHSLSLSPQCQSRRCVVPKGGVDLSVEIKVPEVPDRVGILAARDTDNRVCQSAFLPQRALVVFNERKSSADGFRIEMQYERPADLAIYVRSPDGKWFCDRGKQEACTTSTKGCLAVEIAPSSPGQYRVWVGSYETLSLDDVPMMLVPGELPALVSFKISRRPSAR